MGAERGDMVVEQLSHYSGSTALSFICDFTSLSIDQINFITCQVVALLLSYILRKWIRNPLTRLWFTVISGISICLFCFGTQIFHIIISAGLSYLIISSSKSRTMPWLVLVASMGYLSFLHIKRQFYDTTGYSLDITGPLMVLTQKMTSLAFSIMDGIDEKKENQELSPLQKQRVVREAPTFLKSCSYIFQFQSMLAGPLVFYDDFLEFIEAQDEVPSPGVEVGIKLIKSTFFVLIFLGLGPKFDVQHVRSAEFLDETSNIYKMAYIVVSTTVERCKYYHAWILSDAVCNMSGLGYDRVKGTFDLVSNVHPFRLELSLNMKEVLDNWNIGTMKWLRYVVYERSPVHVRTYLVYMVSAFWHGFYPGYYITFFSGAIFTTSGRVVRKLVRPFFLSGSIRKLAYDFVTWCATRCILAYITFAFVVQDFYPTIAVYTRIYFFFHVLALLSIYLLPLLVRKSTNNIVESTPKTSTTLISSSLQRVNGTTDLRNLTTSAKNIDEVTKHETKNSIETNEETNMNQSTPDLEESQTDKEIPTNEEDWKTHVMNSYDTANNSAKLKTG